MNIRLNWRLASRVSVITLAVFVVILVTLVQKGTFSAPAPASTTSSNTSTLQGTDLGKTPAPGFQLTDQNGQKVALSDFKGKPVIVTFLYTHCPDVCPLTAEKLHTTMLQLGKDASNVGILAVSVDPKGDTQAAALNFTQTHNMQTYWHYLIGTQNELAPVWSSYSINSQKQLGSTTHTDAIYLIDKHGLERVYMDSQFEPTQMASNLKTLLSEN